MSVHLQLIKPKYYFEADDDGEVSFNDGIATGPVGPSIFGYGVSKGGVLTITRNLASRGRRISFTTVEFGPNAWASIFGTEQSEIDEMDDLEFEEAMSSAADIHARIREDDAWPA